MRLDKKIKMILFIVLLMDFIIFGIVKSKCGNYNYFNLLLFISIQALFFLRLANPKISKNINNIFKSSNIEMNIAFIFLLCFSFYLLVLTRKGVDIYGGIESCSNFL